MTGKRESQGFRLPAGAFDKAKFEDAVKRIAALEVRVAKLEGEKEEPTGEQAELVAKAIEAKLGAPSVVRRWSIDKLKAELAKAEA